MAKHEYLRWMAANTPTQWCNDSALVDDLRAALESGAIGCTSNPPLTFQALTENAAIHDPARARIPAGASGDARVVELLGVVVRHISGILMPTYEKSEGRFGYIRSQVQPSIGGDAEAMLAMGLIISTWGPNVMVKIPGTKAGMGVLEELASRGIPTTATVCVSVSQIVAAAEANERGVARALAAGRKPARSTAAIVMGRLQDYLTALNQERGSPVAALDLEGAALATAKRCYAIFKERGFSQVLMPAAFRSWRQVEGLVGSAVHMTIHPKIQDELIKADSEGKVSRKERIDEETDEAMVERVGKALPEFLKAYAPGGLPIGDFDAFGATKMTLDGFDVTGWQKLRALA